MYFFTFLVLTSSGSLVSVSPAKQAQQTVFWQHAVESGLLDRQDHASFAMKTPPIANLAEDSGTIPSVSCVINHRSSALHGNYWSI